MSSGSYYNESTCCMGLVKRPPVQDAEPDESCHDPLHDLLPIVSSPMIFVSAVDLSIQVRL
jgi:hypothetical protein